MFLTFDYLAYACALNNWHVGNNIVITNCDYRMDAVVYPGAESQRRASKYLHI